MRHRHDSWMVADSSVFNLWVGLTDAGHVDYVNDVAEREFQQFAAAGATFAERQRVYREKLFDFVQDTGIVSIFWEQFTKQYVRLLCAETQFTGQLPGSLLPAYTFSAVPIAALIRGYAYLMHAVVLGLGVFGICLLRWRPFAWPQLLLLFIVYNLGLFFFIHVKTRYVLQFLPMLMMFAGLAVQAVFQRQQQSKQINHSLFVWTPLRLGVGGVAVIVIESVAFLPLIL